MNHYLGVDIGTSGCKAVVFDENGRQVSTAYREYNIISKHAGWAELDTDEVMEKCFQTITESASQLEAGSVVGLGISSQGEAFTMIDNEGKALCHALVSSDIRANDLILPWTEKFGEEKLYQITGHTPHPMFSLFKLLWMKKNAPEIWKNTHRVLCFEDLLQYRLGIKNPSMGWPLAGRTMLFDVVNHTWDDEILESLGLRKEQLSVPLQSGSFAGCVNKELSKALNLAENAFVVTGGHDQPCSALGAGAIEPGIAVYSLGTVECITPAFDKPVFTEELRKSNLCTYDHTVPGIYATVAFSLTGGNILKWFRDEFGASEVELAKRTNSNPYDLLMGQMPEEPSRLLVLPYFTASGTPYFDVSVKGAILGLDLSTTREELMKALLEGVAFEIKLNLEILRQSGYEVNELRVIGGGAKQQRLVQLKSDVIGKPITVLDVTEAGCMGVAMLAKAFKTQKAVGDIAKNWVKPVAKVEPKHHEYYNQKFNRYKILYPALKELHSSTGMS
ncbi:MAG: FGGY family carbohydrate kinase [Prolixibacteraceae bacterium]|jgi:xylulokinase|nr:FGGY family carbohydrate kinase [Prolixibacteraceae bacterium]